MKSQQEKLVPVRSADEIRAGMAMVLVRELGRRVNFIALRPVTSAGIHVAPGKPREPCGARRAWVTTMGGGNKCFCISIPEGRLFRLADDVSESDEREVHRELAR